MYLSSDVFPHSFISPSNDLAVQNKFQVAFTHNCTLIYVQNSQPKITRRKIYIDKLL
jgi:hypothetical protein